MEVIIGKKISFFLSLWSVADGCFDPPYGNSIENFIDSDWFNNSVVGFDPVPVSSFKIALVASS